VGQKVWKNIFSQILTFWYILIVECIVVELSVNSRCNNRSYNDISTYNKRTVSLKLNLFWSALQNKKIRFFQHFKQDNIFSWLLWWCFKLFIHLVKYCSLKMDLKKYLLVVVRCSYWLYAGKHGKNLPILPAADTPSHLAPANTPVYSTVFLYLRCN
jgi:hypothetical protein